MKILILNTFKEWGGGEWWTVILGKGLKSMGHHVVIACPTGTETEKNARRAGLEVFQFDIGPDVAFWKIPPMMRYLKKHRIDVMLCNQNRDVKIGALAGRLANTPAIFARQGLDIMRKKWSHKIPFTKFIDGIITNTNALKELYMSYGWFDQGFIHAVHDGIEIPEEVAFLNLHDRYDLPEQSKVIVSAGRLMPQKGFDLLVKVAGMAKDKRMPWRFLVAGTGKSEDDLKKLASSMGVDDYIRFIGFQSDVLPLMKSADLFVLSSRSESMSNVLREAMVVRTACVATDVQGVNELIEDGISGLIVESGKAESIYLGIEKVLSDPELQNKLAENGHDRVKTAFDLDRMTKKIAEIFQAELLRKKTQKVGDHS